MNPDFRVLEQVLRRQGVPSRVPLYEHFVDDQVVEKIMGFKLDDPGLDPRERVRMRWKRLIQFYLQLGYDYLPMQLSPQFIKESNDLYADDTAIYSKGKRNWINEHTGPIQTEADLDNTAFWPSVDRLVDYELFEDVGKMLPRGMAVVGGVAGGPFEHVFFNMGLESLCIALYEKPVLVKRFVDKVGELLAGAAKRLAGLRMIGAYRFADDMGFKTGTLISPAKLRELIFPWHKRIVAIAHEAGKPFVLHACGNLEQVMDDLIDEVRIDAKQANEDAIMPIEEVKRRWGDRVAILGGLDVHFLCTATRLQVAERTKQILDACAPTGGFALGTGNTVTNYVPVENYLAMVNAVHEWNGV